LTNNNLDYISSHIFKLFTNYAAGRCASAMHSVHSRQKWHVDVYLISVTPKYTGACQQCSDTETTSLNYFKKRSLIRPYCRPTALPSISCLP